MKSLFIDSEMYRIIICTIGIGIVKVHKHKLENIK